MPELDRKALKEAALKATPGPWNHDGERYTDNGSRYEEITSSAETILGEGGASVENCAFISLANPATILSLLASLEEADGREAGAQAAFKDLDAWIDRLTARAVAAEQRERRLREALEVARDYALPTLNGLIESNCHPEIVATAEAHKAQVLAAFLEPSDV